MCRQCGRHKDCRLCSNSYSSRRNLPGRRRQGTIPSQRGNIAWSSAIASSAASPRCSTRAYPSSKDGPTLEAPYLRMIMPLINLRTAPALPTYLTRERLKAMGLSPAPQVKVYAKSESLGFPENHRWCALACATLRHGPPRQGPGPRR